MALLTLGGVFRTLATVFIFLLLIQAQKRRRRVRQIVGQCDEMPELSQSRLCRCLHRPNTTGNYVSPPNDTYVITNVPIDYLNFGPQNFPNHSDTVCVYFGHAGPSVSLSLITQEFAMEAVNEYGWPTGTWMATDFKGICMAPTSLQRITIGNETLFDYADCYDEDITLGTDEGWYTETSQYFNPNLFHYHYPVTRMYGMTALLFLNRTDVNLRPKRLKFIVEAPFIEPGTMTKADLFRMESVTYDVRYDPNDLITLTASGPEIELNLDYAYQIRKRHPPSGREWCLEPPPPPPQIPYFDEMMCACFLYPRQPLLQLVGSNTVTHNRLNLSTTIPPFFNNSAVAAELTDYYEHHNDTIDQFYMYTPSGPGLDNYLVILTAVLPVYRYRTWREREFAMGDFLFNGGLPVGRFINPHVQSTARIYDMACDEAVASLSNPDVKWTRPPYPAVGDCLPYDPSLKPERQPCYFHFHSDYYFVDCVDVCDKPKYICAVWTFDDNTTRPFEFQFISNHVYYHNKDASTGNWQLPVNSPCSAATTPGVKNWNLLEVHLFNEAYHKRTDLWIYNPYVKPSFKFIDVSNTNSDAIVSESYLNETTRNISACVEPAAYFLEIKDNNLCRCTFWKTNVDSWQTHYGRHRSCTHGAHTKDFKEHFKIEFHSRQPDNVKVRVYTDLVAEPRLLDDYFVLHAIYIQAFDQHGIPVGRFHKGHWFDPSAGTSDKRCRSDAFPSNTDPTANRYPIFDLIDCNKHPAMPDIGVKVSTSSSNLFLYQNRWRDGYDHVCAQYSFKKQDFPHVTRVQFMAFLRIEDKFDDGEAYMVEIRSETLNATNFAGSPPTEFATGVHEDKNVSYPPLNYFYYKNTLTAKSDHWERPCIDPVKEPDRLFDVCRHYITTPDTLLNKRVDLDKNIDLYNHNCVQWINANINFGSMHQYTQDLANNLKVNKVLRDEAILFKKCFSLQAFRTRRKNAWHVRFRVNSSADPYCENFDLKYLKETALVAYNENGYPTGRPGGKREYGGSFELYNYHETQANGRHEHCAGDDIELSLDDEINNNRMAFFEEKGMCWYDPNAISAYRPDDALFHQDFVAGHFLDYIPSLFLWGNFARVLNGFCAIWFFPNIQDLSKVTPPKYIQFVLEAQILHTGVSPPAPDPQGARIITVRSPKYLFNYDNSAFMHTNPPNPRQDSVHPSNLDSSVSDQCHGVELPIEYLKRPDDSCVCELRSLGQGQGSSTPNPPPGQLAPLCVLKYEFYNHIQDNKLYRLCLSKEDSKYGNEEFPLDDCRTKLEYPRPPEVYPNEIIKLENIEEDNYTNIINLEPFDPTDDAYYGCNLIKKCISQYAVDQHEANCINDRSCPLLITFGKGLGEAHHHKDEITIEIFAVARGWAAVAISPEDEYMGEDYVMECTKEGGEVNVYHSWNIRPGQPNKRNRSNLRLRGEHGLEKSISPNIRPVKTVFYQDKLYCKFHIKKRFTIIDPDLGEKHEYDLDKFYYFNSAYSHALTEPYGEERGNLRTHHLNGGQSEIGKPKIAAGDRLSPLPFETRKFRLHALFMTLAWMFFLTLSIFVARYFKETLINTKILKMEFWYFVHIMTGGLASICLALGVVFQLSASHGWRTVFRSNFHTYSGILAFCLFCAEIVVGCFMKRTLDVKKPLINWIHNVMGHFAYNLSLLNMIFSDRVAFGFLACNFGTYIWVWVAVYYLLHASMSYHYCWVDYILGRSINNRQYGAFNLLTQTANEAQKKLKRQSESRRSLRMSRKLHDLVTRRRSLLGLGEEPERVEAPGKYVRLVALIMFTLITMVYTFWAVRKLVTYPRFCYDFYQLKYLEEHGFN